MKTTQEKEIIPFIQTPRTQSAPVKIDVVLAERIRAFRIKLARRSGAVR